VMPADEADVFLVAAASRDSSDHFAANDDRAGRVFVSQLRIGNLGVPYELSCPRIDSDDMRVIRRSEDLVSIDGDVSLDASTFVSTSAGRPLRETRDGGLFCATATRGGCACLRHLVAIFPDQVSSYAVQRLNNATRVRQVHDAVVDEWCRPHSHPYHPSPTTRRAEVAARSAG